MRGGAAGAESGTPGHQVLITGHMVLILQLVPAFNLLVFVLQTLIPMFQALAFS